MRRGIGTQENNNGRTWCRTGTCQASRGSEGWEDEGQEVTGNGKLGVMLWSQVWILVILYYCSNPSVKTALYPRRSQESLNNGANNSSRKTFSAAVKFIFTSSILFNSQKNATNLYDSSLTGKYNVFSKINMYILGLLTTTHLKVLTMKLEARLVPGNSLWKGVRSLGQVAGWAAARLLLTLLKL